MKKCLQKAGVIFIWICIWQLLAWKVNHSILMAAPMDVLKRLAELCGSVAFYRIVAGSFLRIMNGFVLGVFVGVFLAVVCTRVKGLKTFLNPLFTLIKSAPVASFVVLILIWWGTSVLTVVLSFFMVVPQIFFSLSEGLENMDKKLLEMAQVYCLPFRSRLHYIYLPSLKPYVIGNLKASLGMCWKAGVAAELIGVPDWSIGEQLYLSKIYLDTTGVFAWTAIVILLSVLLEWMTLKAFVIYLDWEPACKESGLCRERVVSQKEQRMIGIQIQRLNKSYQGKQVFCRLDKTFEEGKISYLREPSGSGKTTLFRIIVGLEKPDNKDAIIKLEGRVCLLFQEDRLLENYSAIKNIELLLGNKEASKSALLQLLNEEDIDKPCSQLSGGMKRRVALVRAMESEADIILLDEPFTGMDMKTIENAKRYIEMRGRGKTVLIASHI